MSEPKENGVNRSIQGKLRLMETKGRKLYAVEIMALNSEVNRNGWQYVNLEAHLNEFLDIPLLTAYVGGGMIVGDGHNFDMRRDRETGEEYASFTASDAERIVGWIPKDESNVRLEMIDGTEWVVVKGYLWAWYAKELVDSIIRQGDMEVSIETLVTKERAEGDVEVEEEYIVLGITILGNGVSPAVVGANIRSLSALTDLRKEMAENILKAASFIGEDTGETKETNEPKENNEEVTDLDYFNRKQLAALDSKFNGYRVIGAARSENGIHVCLMAQDGTPAIYTMGSEEDVVVPEKIVKVSAEVAFTFNEDTTIFVDSCDMTDTIAALCTANAEALVKASNELAAANETIRNMETAEKARRLLAAKAAAKAELAEFNANRKAKVPETVLDAINADIDAGMYTERVNSEGAWTGDSDVVLRVKAACADIQKELDRKTAEDESSVFYLDKFTANKDGGNKSGIGGLLTRLGKTN